MGERALIQLIDSNKRVSPTLYLHWRGMEVGDILVETEARMADRPNDVDYAFARLVQIACDNDNGNTSFGVCNAFAVIDEGDSPGDAGCFLVDISEVKWKVMCCGGYGLQVPGDDDDGDDAYAGTLDVQPWPERVAVRHDISNALCRALGAMLSEQGVAIYLNESGKTYETFAPELLLLVSDGLDVLQPDDDNMAVFAAVLSDVTRRAAADLMPPE